MIKDEGDVDKFLKEIFYVCEKHGMSISHEDCNGSFEIVDYNRKINELLYSASVRMKKK